jgi:hypothetical protein
MGLKIKRKTEKREIRRKKYRNTEKERLKVHRKTEHRIGLRAEWLNKANSRSNRDILSGCRKTECRIELKVEQERK